MTSKLYEDQLIEHKRRYITTSEHTVLDTKYGIRRIGEDAKKLISFEQYLQRRVDRTRGVLEAV